MAVRSAILPSLLLLVACASTKEPAHPAAPPAPVGAASAGPPSPLPPEAAPGVAWNCFGEPPDIAGGWRVEVASVEAGAPDALERAQALARDKLRAASCGSLAPDSAECTYLAKCIDPWKTGRNNKSVCASVAIRKQCIDEWNSPSLADFDRALKAGADRILALAKRKKIAIARVFDDESTSAIEATTPGGTRADWVALRYQAKFPEGTVSPPMPWTPGMPVPADWDVIVVGRLHTRSAAGLPTVEVIWEAYHAGGKLTLEPAQFPTIAGPTPPPPLPKFPSSPALSVAMTSPHPGGGLCPGETTTLWAQSLDRDVFIRVFDLWGKDAGTLLYPEGGNGFLRAGQPLNLGTFEAYPLAGSSHERFMVVAAPTEEALGPYKSMKRACVLPSNTAATLLSGGLPPGLTAGVTGYRVLDGPTCPAVDPKHSAEVAKAVAALPPCP